MDAAGGLAGSGDEFTDELISKAIKIQELAIRKRTEEITRVGAPLRVNEQTASRLTGGGVGALEEWYSWIPEAFIAFTRLPDPANFDAVIDSMGAARGKFLGEEAGDVASAVWGRMNSTRDWICDWYGEAATQFIYFADPFQYLPGNHGAIADVLHRAVAADKRIMEYARNDVRKIADATIAALEANDYVWGGDDVSLVLTVVAAVAGFVSTVATGGTSLPIYFAAVSAAGSVGAELAGQWGGDEPSKKTFISGHTTDAILDSMLSALSKLEDAIEAEERKIIGALNRTLEVITDPKSQEDVVGREPLLASLDRRSIPTGFVPPS